MALINCPECQNEVSEHAKLCPHCGYHIKQKKLISSKKTKIVFYIVVIAVIITTSLFLFSIYNISPDEEIAITNVKDLKSMLKDPDSLKLYEDVLIIWYTDLEGDYNFYTYINYGAKNSYGAMSKSIAMYKGYSYIGDMEDIEDINIEDINIAETDSEKIDEQLKLLKAKIPYLCYMAKGIDNEKDISKEGVKKVIRVNKNKIMRRINLLKIF